MDRLLTLLRERSFSRRPVVLASGRESDFFIDCKQTALLAEGHALVGSALIAEIATLPERPVAVAGVALGGCSLASSVAILSQQAGAPLDAIYVRKAVKDHGSARRLEGDGHLERGARVVVVEDVITTGGSTRLAIEALRDRGLEVVGVVALVDRREGGLEALEAEGVVVRACYGREHFIEGT